MTNTDIRDIFSTFQNLNLLRLMDDLRDGKVHRRAFVSRISGNMCPVAHGLMRGKGRICDRVKEALGCRRHLATNFYGWWDAGSVCGRPTGIKRAARDAMLLSALESIWKERLEDADVVQAVCEPSEQQVLELA